VKYCTVNLNV